MAESLARLLRWYAEMGVDIAVDDAPHDRFAESRAGGCLRAEMRRLSAAPPETIEIGRRVMREPATALPAEAIEAARDQAAAAQNLADLREKLSRFEGFADARQGNQSFTAFFQRQRRDLNPRPPA